MNDTCSRGAVPSIAAKAFLILLGIGAGLALGLAALELWLRHTHTLDLQRYAVHRKIEDSPCVGFRPAKDIELGWEHASCSRRDPFGNGNARFPLEKGPGVFRVLAIGDSITEQGYYVSFLNELLNAEGGGRTYEVWNGGVGCYNLIQYRENLRKKGFALDPDLVIIGFCLNDLDGGNWFVGRGADGGFQFYDIPLFRNGAVEINRTLFFHSQVYRWLKFQEMLASRDPADAALADDDLPEESFRRIVAETRERKVRLFAVIIPYLKSRYTPAETRDYQRLKTLLEGSRVPFIDLHGAFPNVDDPAWRDSADDHIHPSKKGHRVIAERIYEYLANHPETVKKER